MKNGVASSAEALLRAAALGAYRAEGVQGRLASHFRDAVDHFLANWPETAVKTPIERPLMKSCQSAAARETATACGEAPATSPAGRGRTLALVGLLIAARPA
ncbi:hypothetical protein [Streptomyces tubercidicus]